MAGISLYHQGSANLDDEQLRDEPVDVFLAGIAGLYKSTPRYWSGYSRRGWIPALSSSQPTDNFFAPLGGDERFLARGQADRAARRGGPGLTGRADRRSETDRPAASAA